MEVPVDTPFIIDSSLLVDSTWTTHELFVLRCCIQKFGCGVYQPIVSGKHLLHKTPHQIYLKLLEVMALSHLRLYHGLHVDIFAIRDAIPPVSPASPVKNRFLDAQQAIIDNF